GRSAAAAVGRQGRAAVSLTREINRLLVGMLIVFGLVALAAAYWGTIGPDTLLRREDNPRLVIAEAAIRRGLILDRTGSMLATNVMEANDQVTRYYPHPETSSVTGYSSLRYGVGGAEAAYNDFLRGDNLSLDVLARLSRDLLHHPQIGSDIQLTLDLNIQQAILRAMGDQSGAVVVLAVPSGEVLGLISLPSFDPNTLDENWEQLATSTQKPFFNRALQSTYQPGGILQTPLMAAALLANEPLTEPLAHATDPITVDAVVLNCAFRLSGVELSLRDAYAFACPSAFSEVAQNIGSQALQQALAVFHFNAPPVLEGFAAPARSADQGALSIDISDDNLVQSALGQGNLTVTPLQIAVMSAAIINDGNAPHPTTLLATRDACSELWTSAPASPSTIPFTTEKTARQLQDLMRNAVANGAALNAARPGIDIGGHATLAYSGDETQAWFTGFVTIPGKRGIALAVVLENSDDPGRAADIGGSILEAAHDALMTVGS
ncbi:MAG: hypothetical protein K8J31_18750, partial [Anaerolineae bacterium]|nr:hypothetical protein [Anaerolineae bacterium]